MAKAIIERKGNRVRVRGQDFPIDCAVSIEGKPIQRARLEPNKWVEVSDEIYEMLKQKNRLPDTREVPDMHANEKFPHMRGDAPIMRTEPTNKIIIEGLE